MSSCFEQEMEKGNFARDVIFTALFGGVDYWADAYNYESVLIDGEQETTSVDLVEWEDATEFFGDIDLIDPIMAAIEKGYPTPDGVEKFIHRVDVNGVLKAIDSIVFAHGKGAPLLNSKMSRDITEAWEEMDAGEIDSCLADAIVQLAAMGEIRYG